MISLPYYFCIHNIVVTVVIVIVLGIGIILIIIVIVLINKRKDKRCFCDDIKVNESSCR